MAGTERVRTGGKFFRLGERKWYLKGLTYGPFAPNAAGEFFPDDDQVRQDFALMRMLGANTIRVYFPPPERLLDLAAEHGLRVLVDVPWEKHRCFFEDWSATQAARQEVRAVARRLGSHPAVLGVSVVNEVPNDVVRFYGHPRLERFVDELLDTVHQEAPGCLATFANYPTTEFLQPRHLDFHCFNVYLHDPVSLSAYLERLQHLAGAAPLVLGEHGVDSLRAGETEQAEQLAEQVRLAFRCGAAGSVVFSFTDDWFTGGHQIEDWAFGLTRRDRSEKPAATVVRDAWKELGGPVDASRLPSISVVVCSYNGSRTLEECLESLMRLDYPDYEVILVDDGSTDSTPEIAARFPNVRTIRQENEGLSVARNVGARAARGEIVAYTDDDCVVDEGWLLYLAGALADPKIDAVGGPNISPPSDNWVAKCVAASPGNPSHVMLDDRRAEHVPGCNMAYRRDVLLRMGGFDPQFRQAGDDVDVCWRLLDEGRTIGFAAGAMVWHHRRCTLKTYLKQQKGYGRAEAMVQFKHPGRFGQLGGPSFCGVIYGDGAVGLPVAPPRIYHGRFGTAPYQTIYRQQSYGLRAWLTSFEWHVAACCFLLLALLVPELLAVPVLMWCATIFAAISSAVRASLPKTAPWWSRPLVAFLYLSQPLIRGGHRYVCRLTHKRLPALEPLDTIGSARTRRISWNARDLYWETTNGIGRRELLDNIVDQARRCRWAGDFESSWTTWDLQLSGDPLHDLMVRTATEELAWPRRFTRARTILAPTGTARLLAGTVGVWMALALVTATWWAVAVGLIGAIALATAIGISRSRCFKAAERLLNRAATAAALQAEPKPLPVTIPEPYRRAAPAMVRVNGRRLAERWSGRPVVAVAGGMPGGDRTSNGAGQSRENGSIVPRSSTRTP